MPFIVTITTAEQRHEYGQAIVTGRLPLGAQIEADRTAVHTLQEARATAAEIVLNVWDVHGLEGELGEYQRPLNKTKAAKPDTCVFLPDGTLVEIRPASWQDLHDGCDEEFRHGAAACVGGAAILAAFNAEQGS